MNGIIISSSILNSVAPAMLAHPGARPKPMMEASMFNILPKKCSKCGGWKSPSSFRVRNYKGKKSLNSQCKECESIAARQWQKNNPERHNANKRKWASENREAENARSTAWHKAHPEERRATSKKYRDTHKDIVNERIKDWELRNRDRKNEQARRWRVAHPDKRLEMQNNRRARIEGNGGKITLQEWDNLKVFYNYTCLCCHRREPEIKLTMDHVVPISMGGKNVIENAQPLCQSCNSSKGNRRTTDYR
jgi:5-methylcytosine-specific restriction endonuclease McrA